MNTPNEIILIGEKLSVPGRQSQKFVADEDNIMCLTLHNQIDAVINQPNALHQIRMNNSHLSRESRNGNKNRGRLCLL